MFAWKLLLLLVPALLVGCAQPQLRRDSHVFGSSPRPFFKGQDFDGVERDSSAEERRERARDARLKMFDLVVGLTGNGLAETVGKKRLGQGDRHDKNDESEALLYATTIRLMTEVIRDSIRQMRMERE